MRPPSRGRGLDGKTRGFLGSDRQHNSLTQDRIVDVSFSGQAKVGQDGGDDVFILIDQTFSSRQEIFDQLLRLDTTSESSDKP